MKGNVENYIQSEKCMNLSLQKKNLNMFLQFVSFLWQLIAAYTCVGNLFDIFDNKASGLIEEKGWMRVAQVIT